jgi:hypothetical protein
VSRPSGLTTQPVPTPPGSSHPIPLIPIWRGFQALKTAVVFIPNDARIAQPPSAVRFSSVSFVSFVVSGFGLPISAMSRDDGDPGDSLSCQRTSTTAAWAARFPITRSPDYSITNSSQCSSVARSSRFSSTQLPNYSFTNSRSVFVVRILFFQSWQFWQFLS